ncbi:MAG: HD domain-containing phosphohydrolase [Planctomycetota bacterium]
MTYDTFALAIDELSRTDYASMNSATALLPCDAEDVLLPDTDQEASRATTKTAKIMIVDDEPINVKAVRKYLQGVGYTNIRTTTDSSKVVETAEKEHPDIVLLDIMMRKVSGIEILGQWQANSRLRRIPVVILTAVGDARIKRKALQLGASDFLTKPVDPSELVLRVANTLVVKTHQDHLENYSAQLEQKVRSRTAELKASRRELVQTLARAGEYRDNDTAHHIMRVGRYVGMIGRELGMPNEVAELLEEASLLHDVGKIGISDAILLKPGKLTNAEIEIMRQHCAYGRRIIQQAPNSGEWEHYGPRSTLELIEPGNATAWLIPVAAAIAQTHHEHWDGNGYPLGLAGEDIPIEGRITAVADVFDALSSKRPYKPAFPNEKCIEILRRDRGTHFDPTILDAFLRRIDDVLQVQLDLADSG